MIQSIFQEPIIFQDVAVLIYGFYFEIYMVLKQVQSIQKFTWLLNHFILKDTLI